MARPGSLLAPTASSSRCPHPSAAEAAETKATVAGIVAGREKGRGKKARDGGEDGDGGRGKDDPEEKKEKEKAGRGRGGGGGGGGGEDDVVKKVEADSFNVGA